jgi:hypothetical protein
VVRREIPISISFEWRDGKIGREWHNFDTIKMMAELALAQGVEE